jgi:hypothetical protein
VRDHSLAEAKQIAVGDMLVQVNAVDTSAMPTPLAVRTLTLAAWPRTLYFKVPPKAAAKDAHDEGAEPDDFAEPAAGTSDQVR